MVRKNHPLIIRKRRFAFGLAGAIVLASCSQPQTENNAVPQEKQTVAYEDLEVVPYHDVIVGTKVSTINGVTEVTYFVNEQEVDKATYDEAGKGSTCCPCLVQTFYPEDDALYTEEVRCEGVRTGSYKQFYRDGNIMIQGQYKNTKKQEWMYPDQGKNYDIPDGEWYFFSGTGDTLYTEYWDNGQFINQVPEQDYSQIWKVELTLNQESINNKSILPEEFSELVFTAYYKNSYHSPALTLSLSMLGEGKKVETERYTPADFKNLNLRLIQQDHRIEPGTRMGACIHVFNMDQEIDAVNFSLQY
jgi:antitoxin component YwqK of YwqJK toxin-antitoxin module